MSDSSESLTPPNEFDSIFYYDIEYIVEYSSNGFTLREDSKTLKKSERNYSIKFLSKLAAMGWRKEYLEIKFKYMNDILIQCWPDNLLIENIFKEIIRQEITRVSETDIKNILLAIGLCDDIYEKLYNILYPLLNSKYTLPQILDVGIEFILGHYKSITRPNTLFPIQSEEINKWCKYKHTASSKHIHIYNMRCNVKTLEVIENEFRAALSTIPKKSIKEHEYYFYVVSWSKSFKVMVKVSRYRERPGMDFGIYKGVYLIHLFSFKTPIFGPRFKC